MASNLTLEQEQAAFDAQLDTLVREHSGKYALFRDGKVVGLYDDHAAAYEAGLDRFGLDTPFLIAHVAKPQPEPISVAWDAGVMFGQP
jgi:hypothetical protein